MAKRSRRSRRQEKTKPAPEASVTPTVGVSEKTVDFVSEYAYIYKELRTVIIIAIIMFAVLFGLSYVLY